MYSILFEIGPFKIYSYGFFLALAFFVSSILADKQARGQNILPYLIPNFYFVCLVSGIIGARLFFIILNIRFFIAYPKEIIMLQHGGLVWYGGLISAVSVGVIYLKAKRQSVLSILDLVVPYVALAQSIGRIGCFLNGCCFGRIWPLYGIHYPTQIISSLIMLFVFIILRIFQPRISAIGNTFLLYLIFYSAKRFFIEFLRGDIQPVILGLRLFQIISIVIFLLAAAFFCLNMFSRKYRTNRIQKF